MAQKQPVKKQSDKQIYLIIFAGCLIYLAIKFILYVAIILVATLGICFLAYKKNPRFKAAIDGKIKALLIKSGLKKKTDGTLNQK